MYTILYRQVHKSIRTVHAFVSKFVYVYVHVYMCVPHVVASLYFLVIYGSNAHTSSTVCCAFPDDLFQDINRESY